MPLQLVHTVEPYPQDGILLFVLNTMAAISLIRDLNPKRLRDVVRKQIRKFKQHPATTLQQFRVKLEQRSDNSTADPSAL